MSNFPPEMKVCMLGASPDTGNLGVSALSESIVFGVARQSPGAHLTVFDNGWGLRRRSVEVDGRQFSYALCGFRRSKRYYRHESMLNVRLSARLGGLRNHTAQAIRRADAVLDVSGGDSFSDIYGRARFETTAQAKEIALEQNESLVLLPQTYGPFAGDAARRRATAILRSASAAWARDADSYGVLCDLLGDDHDPDRHRLGVDLAFALEPSPVPGLDIDDLFRDRVGSLAGVNVSGLLFDQPTAGAQFGFRLDYDPTALGLVERLIDDGARVLLTPHVHSPGDLSQSDRRASSSLLERLDPARRERVALLPAGLNAGETKWAIASCDWFCGTRMHSTIAALSSLVPAAAIAYSAKTAGVFAECGQRDQVFDARALSTAETVEALEHAWRRRDLTRDELRAEGPETVRRARGQWDEILAGAAAVANP
jgi:polysaccharide pyruvyl transferase WcaK-like protein